MVSEPTNLYIIALTGCCPRCGKGTMFASWLTIADRCHQCNLSFANHEQGDGPAFFGILIVGAIVAIAAAYVEIMYQPSYLVHALLWGLSIPIASLCFLRWFKAALLAAQYQLRKSDFTDEQ